MSARLQYQRIFDLYRDAPQMVFLSGPRQCGKTTFAKSQLNQFPSSAYLNWDIPADRKEILSGLDLNKLTGRKTREKSLVVLDEIHKFSEWKNYLKGLYDQYRDDFKFLVTGSGRLDFFQKGKDSLAGRYFLFHMWPLTMAELGRANTTYELFDKDPFSLGSGADKDTQQDSGLDVTKAWEQLATCSGFPDPFFSENEKLYRVWSNTYRNQLIREDVRQLTRLEKIDLLEQLVLILPHRVGGLLSIDNLAKDLQVAFDTVKKWLMVLERFYIIFRIPPWTEKISRAISKEQKLYFFDTPTIHDRASQFENMVALELWRAIHNWKESGEGDWALHFVRDRDQREVDFLLVNNRKPFLLNETKLSDTEPSESLRRFQSKFSIPAVQLVLTPNTRHLARNGNQDILICTASQWLANLP